MQKLNWQWHTVHTVSAETGLPEKGVHVFHGDSPVTDGHTLQRCMVFLWENATSINPLKWSYSHKSRNHLTRNTVSTREAFIQMGGYSLFWLIWNVHFRFQNPLGHSACFDISTCTFSRKEMFQQSKLVSWRMRLPVHRQSWSLLFRRRRHNVGLEHLES